MTGMNVCPCYRLRHGLGQSWTTLGYPAATWSHEEMQQRSLLLALGFALATTACEADKDTNADTGADTNDSGETGDGDGDGDGEPADTDEDGLTDEEEAELGTDPTKKDTDGDQYWDSWEVTEGTDPLDPESRIYTGYWPYNPNKDEMDPGDWNVIGKWNGTRFPRDQFLDQHGEWVDNYDFSEYPSETKPEGTYMIIDLSAVWCGPCHTVADWIAKGNNPGLEADYPTIRAKVHEGRVFWLTYLIEDGNYAPPSVTDSQEWAAQHPDPYVPVLADEEQNTPAAYGVGAIPHFFIVGPDMLLEYFPAANESGYETLSIIDAYDF